MAEMTFDGTFSDLKLKVMSESALQAIYPELVKLQDFAKTYSELEDRPGAAIVIPTYDLSAAADFDADSNNYCGGENEIKAANVTLDKHLVKSIAISDRELADTGVQFVKDGAIAIAKTLGKSLNAYVMGMFNSTNISLSATWDVGTKAAPTAHKLYEIAATNGLDVGDSVVVLDPENFSNLLGVLDAVVYGGQEAIRLGYVPGLFGFKSVVCSTYLPEGVNGVIINRNSVGIASRYLAPLAGAYPQTWKATDPDSGFTIGFRLFANLCSGRRYLAGEALVGAKVFYNGLKAVRLINS
ncbi:hypothetical protein [Fibrobacter sp.]|uniref:hypothetical protein n=1 Tax=Fibrobacter sp. TaxID=35828 RepID=UPI00388EF596